MAFGLLFSLIFIAILILCVIKPKYGYSLFLIYFFLVPIIKIQLGSFSIGEKFLFLFISLVYLIQNKDKIRSISFKAFKPFAFLYVALFILILFQHDLQIESIELLILRIIGDLLFPFSLYCLTKIDPDSINLLNKSLLFSLVVVVLYGLSLTLSPGINPYLIITLPLFGQEFNEAYALGHSALNTAVNLDVVEGRIFGRISSVFLHPMQYGLFLSFSLTYVYFCISKKAYKYLLLLIIIAATLTSGVRSPIGAIFIAVLVLLLKRKKLLFAMQMTIALILIFLVVNFVSQDMADYISSIFISSNQSDIKGSSFDMRMEQLLSCFDIIEEHPLTGRGYAWSSTYLAAKTIHPKLLAFESLIYVILCNIGYLGLLIWIIFSIKYLKFIKPIKNEPKKMALLTLFVVYISYSCITGEYNYMKYFMIFFVVILANFNNNLSNNKYETKNHRTLSSPISSIQGE